MATRSKSKGWLWIAVAAAAGFWFGTTDNGAKLMAKITGMFKK